MMTGNDEPPQGLTEPLNPLIWTPAEDLSGDIKLGRTPTGQYKLSGKRWLILFCMAMLNLLSDWTCYSLAPIERYVSVAYPDMQPTYLVSMFLLANVCMTMAEPRVLQTLGLRYTVVLGAGLMLLGSFLKIMVCHGDAALLKACPSSLPIGFILVGLAQPLFQCTPALVSANWFSQSERTMATGVMLNANQVGIGVSYVVGTYYVNSVEDILPYFRSLAVFAFILFLLVAAVFEAKPPHPPSRTQERLEEQLHRDCFGDNKEHDFMHALELLKEPGFLHATAVFVASIVVVNTISTYLDAIFAQVGYTNYQSGYVGASFQALIMASSFIMGYIADYSKTYFGCILVMLIVGGISLLVCGLGLDDGISLDLRSSILVVGLVLGPLQPLATETAVEVAYPCSENIVLVVQQFVGNLASALWIPLFQFALTLDRTRFGFSFHCMAMLHALVTGYFIGFPGKLRRTEMERQISPHP